MIHNLGMRRLISDFLGRVITGQHADHQREQHGPGKSLPSPGGLDHTHDLKSDILVAVAEHGRDIHADQGEVGVDRRAEQQPKSSASHADHSAFV